MQGEGFICGNEGGKQTSIRIAAAESAEYGSHAVLPYLQLRRFHEPFDIPALQQPPSPPNYFTVRACSRSGISPSLMGLQVDWCSSASQ